ncbi:hypothetical protein N781_17225 [Pontibacillus halophilus JSM 076056 = DSM 19796]|uniref:Uncharacterized protein n=1 Tax=Pontibacillus halophilus JSM 076056 = DSM 19796 TaxID=1385510 RepID=A0A0A5I9N8_9BACI|nr:hypothetical protein N781_17225 [Pontibacillus halophilus JSM 076056 = DSM 19796]
MKGIFQFIPDIQMMVGAFFAWCVPYSISKFVSWLDKE